MRSLPEDALARESDWLRALARRLVRDPNEADDLRQATLLEALERPPRDGTRLRGWLGAVLRNRLRQERRSGSRREFRERRAALGAEAPDPSDVVARAATFRELANRVVELDEPFRTAVLLRFYDDLPPRRIAERMGVPVATVRSRIRRGLERLRSELDDSHGGRAAWALALLPKGIEPVPAGLAATLMHAKTKIALVVAALTVGVVSLDTTLRSDRPAPPSVEAARPETVARATTPAEPDPETALGRRATEPPAPVDESAAVPAPDEVELVVARGRVLGLDGRGRSGLRVVLRSGDAERARTISDASGRFEVEVTAEAGLFELDEDGWKAISAGAFEPHEGAPEPVIVVAPAARFAGRVVDDVGRPIEGASVLLKAPADLGYRIDVVLDGSQATAVRTQTDAAGRFELDGWIARHSWIEADRRGYLRTEIPAPDLERSDLELVLAPRAPVRELAGRVVDPSGEPVPDAWVSVGVRTTRADEAGRFHFTWNPPMDRVVAVAPGFRPGSFELDSGAVPEDAEPPFARIVLPGPTLALTGRVVDEDGSARPGVRVWIRDPSYFGEIGEDSGVVEGLGAGARTDAEIEAEFAEELDRGEVDAYLEAVASTPSTFWHWVATDADGRFELGGLDERAYTLRAMDLRTLAVVDSEPLAAGRADLELVLPRCGGRELLAGRAVDANGLPVAGARVVVLRHAFLIDRGNLGQRAMSVPCPEVTTDADGRFELRCVPDTGVLCNVSKSGYRTVRTRARDLPAGPWVVELQPRDPPTVYTHVRVELADPECATRFELLGPDERRLPMTLRRGGEVLWRPRANFLSGVSEVLNAPAGNATLLLLKGDVEVARQPVVLLPDRVNRLHYRE